MKDEQIDALEKKYAIKFMPEHREFLKILHTIDRKERLEHKNDGEIIIEERPFFYNWLTDEEEIREKFEWPYRTILEDILGANKVWLKSWGKRPASDEDKEAIFSTWFNKTPKLLPLTSHRFLVSDLNLEDRPVLSIWGSDIIVYGWDLRLYLLNELSGYLDITEQVYYEEYQCYYAESIKEIKEINEKAHLDSVQKDIPYWKEMILFWTSGWGSFGQESPGNDGNTIQPIMPTYIAGNEENN